MTEENIPQPRFEGSIPEADMDRLAGEIGKSKESLDMNVASGKEVVREALRSMAPTPTPQPTTDANSQLPAYTASATAESKMEIEHLLNMAFSEGIDKANQEASKSNPFVLDAFHDALAGKLYPELQKRKLVD